MVNSARSGCDNQRYQCSAFLVAWAWSSVIFQSDPDSSTGQRSRRQGLDSDPWSVRAVQVLRWPAVRSQAATPATLSPFRGGQKSRLKLTHRWMDTVLVTVLSHSEEANGTVERAAKVVLGEPSCTGAEEAQAHRALGHLPTRAQHVGTPEGSAPQ